MVIFKEKLLRTDIQHIKMPKGSVLLSVNVQNGATPELMLWFLCDPDQEIVKRSIQIIGAGNRIVSDMSKAVFIDTVIDGSFVWHIFDKGEVNV